MEFQDTQAIPSLRTDDAGPSSRPSSQLVHFEERPRPESDIWDRVRHGHVATAMRIRSLLLFIASSVMSYLESITGSGRYRRNPLETASLIVAKFVHQTHEFHPHPAKETVLDMLFAKSPIVDLTGMQYHQVYLAVSPIITSVNWAHIDFDRKDALCCYNSLAKILQVCFSNAAVANRLESDQLVLAIYIASVWCSITKRHPQLGFQNGNSLEPDDFETYMKTWIFHPAFENFSRVLVGACYQIMEITDSFGERIERRPIELDTTSPRGPPEIEERDAQPAVSLAPGPSMILDPVPQIVTPTVPLTMHPSWQIPGPYSGYEQNFMFQLPPGMYPHPQPYHPPTYPPVTPVEQQQTPPAKRPRSQKRKAAEQQPQQLPNFEQLTDGITKPRNKKGPKPGTIYRRRITQEATMILRIEAAIQEFSTTRMSKKEISLKTNISLPQVKSFFNRVTAERKRIESGKPAVRRHRNKYNACIFNEISN